MKHKLSDILDIPRLQVALDSLYASSKIPSAIIDNEGKVHTGSGWQDVCTKFHRSHPEARKRCIESDTYIAGHIHEANPSITYKCPHGLVDSATPIIIEGEHLGNVFTGQLFLEEPDLDSFRGQAKAYGFDEDEYIDAVKMVPIISKQALENNLAFVAHLAGMLANMGLEHAREMEADKRLRESEVIFEHFLEHSPIHVFFKDENIRTLRLSRNFEAMLGMPMKEMLGKTMDDLFPSELAKKMVADDMRIMKENKVITVEEELDGRFYTTTKFPVLIEGKPRFLAGYTVDNTENRQAEKALREREEQYATILRMATDGFWVTDRKGRLLEVNDAVCRNLGYSREELLRMSVSDIEAVEKPEKILQTVRMIMEKGSSRFEGVHRCKDGSLRNVEVSVNYLPPPNERFFAFLHDITVRKSSEAEKEKLQAQLLQAMKMEAIGRLAGGVAHDFNNLLTVITGYSEILLRKIGKGSSMGRELEQIKQAGERAASLTHQLLAFSRKQIIEPKVVHLGDMVAEMRKMLTRLIGEDISIQVITGTSLGLVKIDPGQFQQILMNLAVNSRDAMPGGGKIVIEIANVDLDEGYCSLHPYVTPGRYMMLAVSDTGTGMTAEVKAHIFEPFFTTKEKGSGTGLGLATTYGAVKQAGGSIEVYSEVGIGTTLKIYLPRVEEEAVKRVKDDWSKDLPGGTETVLLVEDEDSVRDLCFQILERLGYKVLRGANGTEAIAVGQKYAEQIDLLLTDVVMPGMSGAELAKKLVLQDPKMKVLFTSGYTDEAITRHGILDEGVSFIGKPYTPLALARKVREVLDKA